MVGFYARADASQPIRIDLDNELEGKVFHFPPTCTHLPHILPHTADARWFTRSEILPILGHNFAAPDYKKMTERTEGRDNLNHNPSQGAENGTGALAHSDPSVPAKARAVNEPVAMSQPVDEPPFRLPPVNAIAGLLIRAWADGKIGFEGGAVLKKGNL